MLEQNLLLPPADGSFPIPGSTNDVGERLESTYDELYVQNRAAGGREQGQDHPPADHQEADV